MVTIANDHGHLIGKGIYTPRQAATYARITTEMMSRWIHGNKKGPPVVRAQLQDDEDRFVTFLDLVQAMAIRSIRKKDRKISLDKIRSVIKVAKENYGVEYPFAYRHTTFLFEDDIVIRLQDDTLVQVTGKYKHHDLINGVAEIYMLDLVYDEDNLSQRYVPMKGDGRNVVLDPRVRFGTPYVDSCGITVDALCDAVETEGSMDAAAETYGVGREDVVIALRYADWLAGTQN